MLSAFAINEKVTRTGKKSIKYLRSLIFRKAFNLGALPVYLTRQTTLHTNEIYCHWELCNCTNVTFIATQTNAVRKSFKARDKKKLA